jgi:hypothetical protein
MAVINYSGSITTAQTFASTDTVTATANTTVDTGGSITKTDTASMTFNVAAGVIITVQNTGYIDIKGSRKNFVHFNSNAANKQGGDWQYITFNGSSTSNTMQWCIFSNCRSGVIFQGHTPADGKFRYLIGYNCTYQGPGGYTSQSSGTFVVSDVACVRYGNYFLNSSSSGGTMTWERIYLREPLVSASGVQGLAGCTKTCSINDMMSEWLADTAGPQIAPAAANTITITRGYFHVRSGNVANPYTTFSNGAGLLTLTNPLIHVGGNLYFQHASGTTTITGGDVYGGSRAAAGLFSQNASGMTLSDVALFGTNRADLSVFDTSTATPNSGSTPAQYNGATSVSSPRSSRKYPLSFGSPTAGAWSGGTSTVTATANIVCKARVLLGTATGVYDYAATEWDAPDLYVSEIQQTIPSTVTDWNISGGKYGTSKSIAVNIRQDSIARTYYGVLEGVGPLGERFQSSEFTITVAAAAAGGGGGIVVNTLEEVEC